MLSSGFLYSWIPCGRTTSETVYEQLRDAVFDNDKARLQELLQQHDGVVDVDHFDAGGQTLLHLAGFWGRMELVKVLLSANASLKTKNAAGCTALDLATHWGHSVVAEVIRLRGGRSVWEEKFGHMQVQVEELKLHAIHAQTQLADSKRECERLRDAFHESHAKCEEKCSCAQQPCTWSPPARGADADCRAKAEHLQHESQQETLAVIAHRDEMLQVMQGSIRKQEDAAYNWQRAEVAAAIAESRRDSFQKKHVAALGELVIITARLDTAEDELTVLKTDLAEHIYEKKREQKIKKCAARAMSHVSGNTASNGSSSPAPTSSTSSPSLLASSKVLPRKSHSEEAASLSSSPPPSTPATTATKKKYFSLAAREFGERLRNEELTKQKARAMRHANTENQYLTTASSHRSEHHFEEEFVATLQSFTTTRDAKWNALKKDRDHQARFSRSVLARPIATAPHLQMRHGHPDEDGGGRFCPPGEDTDVIHPFRPHHLVVTPVLLPKAASHGVSFYAMDSTKSMPDQRTWTMCFDP
ncbi:hypothetical protein FI667_g7612, partial [Globisporangium splendens]